MCVLASLTWATLMELGVFVVKLRTHMRMCSSELEKPGFKQEPLKPCSCSAVSSWLVGTTEGKALLWSLFSNSDDKGMTAREPRALHCFAVPSRLLQGCSCPCPTWAELRPSSSLSARGWLRPSSSFISTEIRGAVVGVGILSRDLQTSSFIWVSSPNFRAAGPSSPKGFAQLVMGLDYMVALWSPDSATTHDYKEVKNDN